jgi:hypothetical protein
MIETLIVLTIAGFIGYTAQITGLRMVRGVSDWMRGRRLRLTAIVMAGFWIYLFTPLIAYYDRPFMNVYAFHWTIPLGGLIFGVGAAINGACSISTATRLASGDLRMLLTMIGWLAGWVRPWPSAATITSCCWLCRRCQWAGVSALSGMLAGIWLGVKLLAKLTNDPGVAQ